MTKSTAVRSFLVRERRPGDWVFAVLFLAVSIFLLSQIGAESKWIKGTKTFAQPMFWPAVSLFGMTVFAACHFFGAILSPRSDGRLEEVLFWARSIEYALWFMVYVWIVPTIGYLPSTIVFAILLSLRAGYRERKILIMAAVMAFAIVIVFKGFLSVKIPGGQLYEHLPDSIRNFMLLYL